MKKRQGKRRGLCSSLGGCLNLWQANVAAGKHPGKNIIYGEIIIRVAQGESGPGKAASLCLFSHSNVNPGQFITCYLLPIHIAISKREEKIMIPRPNSKIKMKLAQELVYL